MDPPATHRMHLNHAQAPQSAAFCGRGTAQTRQVNSRASRSAKAMPPAAGHQPPAHRLPPSHRRITSTTYQPANFRWPTMNAPAHTQRETHSSAFLVCDYVCWLLLIQRPCCRSMAAVLRDVLAANRSRVRHRSASLMVVSETVFQPIRSISILIGLDE
jgi:hypothetical protein